MSSDEETPARAATNAQRKLRLIGGSVWILGIVSAGFLYWMRTHSLDPADDSTVAEPNRVEIRQIGILYGSMGNVIDSLSADLKRPGPQAFLILLASTVIAAGFFYLSHPLPASEDGKIPKASPDKDV
jgi:hypothetical protein